MDYSVVVSSTGFGRSPSKVDSSRTDRDHVSKAVTDGFVDSTSKATDATGAESTTADGKASQPKATSRVKSDTPLDSAGANNSSFGGKSGMPGTFTPGSISRSMEKLGKGSSNSLSNATARCAAFTGAPAPVRCSRSQENYFENGDLTLVDIDFDDNKATSVDALQYDTCSLFSFDNSAILNTWTNKCSEDGGGGGMKPRQTNNLETLENWDISGFDDSSPGDVQEPEVVSDEDRDAHETGNYLDDDNNIASLIKPCPADGSRKNATQDSEGEGEEEGDKTDDENLFSHPPTPIAFKDHDRASAARLAKRLYHLEGFKKTDVLRHLSKTNNFSQLVSEEYLKFFDFTDLPLEAALRSYTSHVITSAVDMQDLERLLSHLAIRYHRCNPGVHKSADTCHTLACAMLLLNCDLHIQSTARKMTLLEFIVNLRDMNDGEDFPDEVLTSLYQSIKNQPLKFNTKPDLKSASQSQQQQQGQQQQQQQPGGNRKTNCRSPPTDCQISNGTSTASLALEVPDPNNIKVSKKGYVMRKCCTEPDGRKTRLGKRAWKMMYSTLRGLVLYMHTDEQRASSLKISNQRHQPQTPSFLGVSTSTTSTDANNTNNGNFICIHHSLASRASDYTKKNHVFRLQTADFAQYLIQTSSSKECHEWIEAINFAAASCSSVAAIFPAVEAKATTNLQRPLMPFAYTKLNMKEQLRSYEKMLAVVEKEVLNMCKSYQDKGTKTRRLQEEARVENYLKYEIKRYKTYIRILSEKLATLIRPETGPLAGSTIREVEESSLH